MVAAPPMTTATRKVIDRLIVYFRSTRFSERVLNTDSEPATPASMALIPKVRTL